MVMFAVKFGNECWPRVSRVKSKHQWKETIERINLIYHTWIERILQKYFKLETNNITSTMFMDEIQIYFALKYENETFSIKPIPDD